VIVEPKRDRQAERSKAIRTEILTAAWEAAQEHSLAGFTLRDVAQRVGMQTPSLYSHFSSKNAIYDAMFEQAWRTYLDYMTAGAADLPTQPRSRLVAIAQNYFDFATADLARHQLMDVRIIPNFEPSAEAYLPATKSYRLMEEELRAIGVTSAEDADIFTALIAGLISQQLANDPGGQRWRRLLPRVIAMFADSVGLPGDGPTREGSS
jgi:AcrR family transcriptional regulator